MGCSTCGSFSGSVKKHYQRSPKLPKKAKAKSKTKEAKKEVVTSNCEIQLKDINALELEVIRLIKEDKHNALWKEWNKALRQEAKKHPDCPDVDMIKLAKQVIEKHAKSKDK